MGETKSKKKSVIWIVLLVIIAIAAICSCIWYFQFKKPYDKAVVDFNNAVKIVEDKNSELDEVVNSAQKIVDSGEQPYDENTSAEVTTAIADAQSIKREIPEIPEKTADIQAKTAELLESIDYSATIKNIEDKRTSLENSIKQMKQISNPPESFVIERLQGIDGISGTQAVTEDHDPNGNLNKQGGYTATIYFSSPLVNQDEIYGDDIVDKGTECGGGIEVYATAGDAETRNTYLSSFDGATMFNSGSHTVLGTIVIRTSAKLTATQQNELTQRISDRLVELQ